MKKTVRLKRLIMAILLLCSTVLYSCGKSPAVLVTLSGEKSDMKDYIALFDEDHVFYDLDVETMVNAMKEKKTFVAYFGYPACEWCIEAVPILNQAAKENEMQVGYINTRSNPEWQKNTDIDNYDLLISTVGEYLEYDSDGVRHLYTPSVFFIREGKVIGFHEGTVENHNARNRAMSEEEQEVLRNIYRDMFRDLLDGVSKES